MFLSLKHDLSKQALQEATEAYLVGLFEDSNVCPFFFFPFPFRTFAVP